jgi:hypothetical protein
MHIGFATMAKFPYLRNTDPLNRYLVRLCKHSTGHLRNPARRNLIQMIIAQLMVTGSFALNTRYQTTRITFACAGRGHPTFYR